MKIEKDLMDAQQRVFAAPGGALKEVSSLQSEILEVKLVEYVTQC